jgi:D-threo-aldose 1-dehydrogenase
VVVGAERPEHMRRNAELFAAPPPKQLWAELVAEGLLRADAPIP